MSWHRDDRCATCGFPLARHVEGGGMLTNLSLCPHCSKPWRKFENDWALEHWPAEQRAYLRLLGVLIWREATKEET